MTWCPAASARVFFVYSQHACMPDTMATALNFQGKVWSWNFIQPFWSLPFVGVERADYCSSSIKSHLYSVRRRFIVCAPFNTVEKKKNSMFLEKRCASFFQLRIPFIAIEVFFFNFIFDFSTIQPMNGTGLQTSLAFWIGKRCGGLPFCYADENRYLLFRFREPLLAFLLVFFLFRRLGG